jgi:hypothetical protein
MLNETLQHCAKLELARFHANNWAPLRAGPGVVTAKIGWLRGSYPRFVTRRGLA